MSQFSKCGALPWIDGVMGLSPTPPKHTMEKIELEIWKRVGIPSSFTIINANPFLFLQFSPLCLQKSKGEQQYK